MSIFDWFRKAQNPTELNRATAGRAHMIASPGMDRAAQTGEQLVRRYGHWVHRCISLNAQAAACVPFKLMRSTSNANAREFLTRQGTYKPLAQKTKRMLHGQDVLPPNPRTKANISNMEDLVEVTQHPVLDLLHQVNDWTDGYAFRESMFSDYQIHGRAFTLLVGNGGVDELWRMLPQRTKVVKSAEDFVARFTYGNPPDEVSYGPDEVLWLRSYDPEDPWGGVGPLEAWLRTVDACDAIASFQLNLMQRMGAPDWLVMSEAPLSEPQKRSFRAEWRRLFGSLGMRRENVGFMSNATLERLGDSPKELEFNQSEMNKRDQIGQAFGVPKAILDISEIRANSREAKQQHLEATVWPMVQRWEDMLNAKLVPLFGSGLFLMHESPLPDDVDNVVKLRASSLQAGYSVNEVRVNEGEEPLDDPAADIPMVAAGLVPLGFDPAGEDEADDGMEEEEPVITDGAEPTQVLQGQQLAQALAIVQNVVDEKIPIDAARGMLSVLFNLDDGQVEAILAGVEAFEKPEPEVPPMLPGAAPGQPPAEEPEEEEPNPQEGERSFGPGGVVHDGLSVAVGWLLHKATAEPSNTSQMPPEVKVALQVEPVVNISQPGPPPVPDVKVFLPEQDPPIVNVEQPAIDVHVPSQEPPVVNVPAPVVNVEQPEVHVAVESPTVKVAPPEVNVAAPQVNVKAPEVTVKPNIEVNLVDDAPDD
jgi:HK97 family phage portal protein